MKDTIKEKYGSVKIGDKSYPTNGEVSFTLVETNSNGKGKVKREYHSTTETISVSKADLKKYSKRYCPFVFFHVCYSRFKNQVLQTRKGMRYIFS